jgi:hypothetical protein
MCFTWYTRRASDWLDKKFILVSNGSSQTACAVKALINQCSELGMMAKYYFYDKNTPKNDATILFEVQCHFF